MWLIIWGFAFVAQKSAMDHMGPLTFSAVRYILGSLITLPFALIDTAGWFAPAVEAVVAYVFFGLAAVTDELEHPFRDAVNGLPLDAMCRVIEVSVAEALGEAPAPYLEPVDNVLS